MAALLAIAPNTEILILPMNSRRWNNVTKIVVSSILALLAIGLLFTFRIMITPTIVAFLLAFILSYPVNWIQRRTGWARGATVALIYIALIGLIALTPALFWSRALALVDSLLATLEELVTELENPASAFQQLTFGAFEIPIDGLLQNAGDLLANVLSALPTNTFTMVRGVTTGVLTVVYVLVLNFWLLKDLYKFQRFVFEQIPTDYQEDVRHLGKSLSEIWDAFLRGQLVLGFVVGIVTWLALRIVGMPNAGGLALLAGVMEFLPSVGPGFSAVIGTAVAFFSRSTWLGIEGFWFAVVVVTIYSVIAQVETIHLIPRLVGRRVQLHPAVTFVGIISGAIVFGVLGVLLATPVLASARVILSYIYCKLVDIEPFEETETMQSSVRIRGLVAGRKIDAVVFDLDGTLAELDLGLLDIVVARLRWMDPVIDEERRRRIVRRFMIMLEGPIHFLVTQLRRLQLQEDFERIRPILNMLRGYAAPEHLLPRSDSSDVIHELDPHYKLALISTRSRQTVELFLDKSGLGNGLFASVITREDVRNLLPHSEGLLLAAGQMNLDPNHLLVVSDTDINLRSGRATEMATAGALWGLGKRQDLEDADLLLESPADLCEYL